MGTEQIHAVRDALLAAREAVIAALSAEGGSAST
jgi:hypothetical protein